MKKNHLNVNKQFMVGNGILAFAVILVIVIFLYSSYRLQRRAEAGRAYAERYGVCLSRGFAGDSLLVHVNDSLVFVGTVPADSFCLEPGLFRVGGAVHWLGLVASLRHAFACFRPAA